MPASNKSAVISNFKLINNFYAWYGELCKRSNSSPLSIVKPAKPKNDTVLEFTVDRIKAEEWTPILNALRMDMSLHVIVIRSRITGCKFFYDITSEDKIRQMKKHSPPIYTDFLMKSVVRSLGACMKNSPVLSVLELDGIPLHGEYIELLIQGLKKNSNIRSLSFPHCPITDIGCQQICMNLRFMPNIEHLNLSSCNLTSQSGEHIAKLIKHQQLYRYGETWNKSLRYAEPELNSIAGLKRITLNNNPDIGDEGLTYILDKLEDDLWIKAVDMQKCNITENMANRIIDIVEYAGALTVVDFRNNHLSHETIGKILGVLSSRHELGIESEFQWCMTTSTLADFVSYKPSSTNLSSLTVLQKSRSAPDSFGQMVSCTNNRPNLRKTKTVCLIERTPSKTKTETSKSSKFEENAKIRELNIKLQEEIAKRKKAEQLKNELQKKLDDIRQLGIQHSVDLPKVNQNNSTVSKPNSTVSDLQRYFKTKKAASVNGIKNTINVGSTKTINGKVKTPEIKKALVPSVTKSSEKRSEICATKIIGNNPKMLSKTKTPLKTTVLTNSSLTHTVSEKFAAQNIFESFLRAGRQINGETENPDNTLENVMDYYYDSDLEDQGVVQYADIQIIKSPREHVSNFNSSQSLENFLQEIDSVDQDLHGSCGTKSPTNTPRGCSEKNDIARCKPFRKRSNYKNYNNFIYDACN